MLKLLLTNALGICLSLSCLALNVSVGASGADYTTDGTNDEVEIQNAINAVNASGGGTVTLQDGTYNLQSTYLLPKSNVALVGTSRSGTILTSNRTYSYLIYTNNIAVSNFWLENMTIDAQNSSHASGIFFEKSNRCKISNVKFINVTCAGWHLVFGVLDAQNENNYCRDILIQNCLFDGHKGSLEMLLLYNTKNCRVDNCTFQNKITGCTGAGATEADGNRPVLGLWQKTDSITIINSTFQNNNSREAIYHSNTCSNTLIENCTFTNTGGIQGTNESDWGTFGVPYEKRLMIRNCNMTGGAYDSEEAAIKLGACRGVLIKDCNITNYEEGMVIQAGLAASLPENCRQFAVVRTSIRNSNPNNNYHGLHAGILFQKVGGKMHGFFLCGDIGSTRAAPNWGQEQAVAFTTNSTIAFDSLFWLGTNVTSYNTRPDFKFWDYSVQGSPFVVEECDGGSPPTYCGDCATMSDAAIEARIRTYDAETADTIRDLLAYQAVQIVLPVELLHFKGHAESRKNVLNWQTASEINTQVFEIQRFVSNGNFKTMGSMRAAGKAAVYQFSDDVLEKGIHYYRLKIVDGDGKVNYSKVISIENETILPRLNLYPNPAMDVLTIENVQNEAVEIVNMVGQVVLYEKKVESILNIRGLPSGVYWVRTGGLMARFVKH
jgi:Secretion system C-terminal sorting domain